MSLNDTEILDFKEEEFVPTYSYRLAYIEVVILLIGILLTGISLFLPLGDFEMFYVFILSIFYAYASFLKPHFKIEKVIKHTLGSWNLINIMLLLMFLLSNGTLLGPILFLSLGGYFTVLAYLETKTNHHSVVLPIFLFHLGLVGMSFSVFIWGDPLPAIVRAILLLIELASFGLALIRFGENRNLKEPLYFYFTRQLLVTCALVLINLA
jgi:hypothetical protein